MSSHVVVIDTTFRRTTIKVTPGKFLTDVLEEACGKLGLKASNYGLKNNNKPVDLSRTFRQTGLSSGAKLELVVASRTPSAVAVALQLPESDSKSVPGGRLTDKFPSNTTLWLILRKFESSNTANFNFTGRGVAQTESGDMGAGRIFYEQPVLNIMGRELASFEDLQKTLAQLGLNSGSGLIRLAYRKTATPLEEAMAQIDQHFKSIEQPQEDAGAHAESVGEAQSSPDAKEGTLTNAIASLPNPETSTSMDVDPPTQEASSSESQPSAMEDIQSPAHEPVSESLSAETVVGPGQRAISVFAAPSDATPSAARQPYDEADYEPTIAHAKLHQSRLLANSQNKRLASDRELEEQAKDTAAKQAAIKEVSIKVRFPDQTTVVSSFTPLDTASELYEFVKGVILAEDQPFTLVWSAAKGPQTVPKGGKQKLIGDLKFQARMLVNFLWDDGASDTARTQPTLKEQFRSKAQEIKVAEIKATQAAEVPLDKGKGKENDGEDKPKPKGGVPKWLKLGKK